MGIDFLAENGPLMDDLPTCTFKNVISLATLNYQRVPSGNQT